MSLQTTRRFDALKLWTTLRALGPGGVGAMVDAVCELGAQVHADLADDPELRVLGRTPLLQRIPARIVGVGVRPEHVHSPAAPAA